jgi:hypothetical protein
MTERSAPVREFFTCPVIHQDVTVIAQTFTHGPFPAKQMKDCSGAYDCKLFGSPPIPARFSSPISVKCPYHDRLNTTTT